MRLGEAVERVVRKDYVGALHALLEAWRTKRHPRIADVIDKVDARIRRPKGFAGDTVDEQLASWFALAESQQPEVFKQITAGFWPPDWRLCGRMLALLAAWPADPRFTKPLCAYLREPRFPVWGDEGLTEAVPDAIVGILRASGDVRVCRQAFEVDHPAHPLATEPGSPMPKLHQAVDLVHALRREPMPVLTADEEARLAELERMLRMRDPTAIDRAFALVYSQRDSPEARAVFLDQLHELKHPDAKYFSGATWPKPPTMVRMVPDALYDLKRMGFSSPGHLLDKGRLRELPTADRLAQPHWANLSALWLPPEQEPLRAYPWFAALPTVLGVDYATATWATTHPVTWKRLGTDDLGVLELLPQIPSVTHVYAYVRGDRERVAAMEAIAEAPQVRRVSLAYLAWCDWISQGSQEYDVDILCAGAYPDFEPLYSNW